MELSEESVRTLGRLQMVWWPRRTAGTTERTFSLAWILFSEKEEILVF